RNTGVAGELGGRSSYQLLLGLAVNLRSSAQAALTQPGTAEIDFSGAVVSGGASVPPHLTQAVKLQRCPLARRWLYDRRRACNCRPHAVRFAERPRQMAHPDESKEARQPATFEHRTDFGGPLAPASGRAGPTSSFRKPA